MRARTRWLLLCVLAALVVASPAQGHRLKKPKTNDPQVLHRYHHRSHKHASQVLRWFERHSRNTLYSRKTETRRIAWVVVRNHRWLRRVMKRKIDAYHRAQRARPTPGMIWTTATWYGPGLYGNRTKCGQTLTTSSWWVASMVHGCGTKLTICVGSRCARTTVQDSGAFHPGNFDLAPGVAAFLGCYCTQRVRWRLGW